MKYQRNEKVITLIGTHREEPRILTVVEIDPNGIWGQYHLSDDRWYPEDYLMSLDELQQLRAENERLKVALETIDAEISQWSQIQAPPDVNTSVAVIARIESLVSEALEPDE